MTSRAKTRLIYLDHAATTPVATEVVRAMAQYWQKTFGNPSSAHWFGQEAIKAVDGARETLARFLGASPLEVYFTGSATEADNLAVAGVASALTRTVRFPESNDWIPHVIISAIEHEAVLEPCRALEKTGAAEVTYVSVGREGVVRAEDVAAAIRPNTALVSVMYANSEIGTIQPIAEIGAIIKKENERRAAERLKEKSKIQNPKSKVTSQNSKLFPVRFHTDAVQAAQFLDCNVDRLNVDLLTLSAHKIYGPKGIGALYIRRGTPVQPLIRGGGQERGLRSGTENVPYIVGFAKAIELIEEKPKNYNEKLLQLRDHFIARLLKEIPDAALNASRDQRLPNNVNIRIPGVQGETLIIALEQMGIAVSTGSACASRGLKPSHVLAAIGVDTNRYGSLRLTLGRSTTKAEIDYTVKALKEVVEKLRNKRQK